MCERETTGIASGFTPVFDEIARDPKLGPIAALVFGKVWRYCNAYGKCTASRDSMAQQVGLSYKTFGRWLAVLCEKGYLEDLTPNRRHRPHHYRDTGKVKMRVRVKAEGGTESQPGKEVGQRVQPGRTESPTRTDLESVKEREKRETEKDNREREALMGLSGPSLFIMPNGQYKGKTLQQILDLGDTGYIHWVSKHWRSENIRRAAADIAVKAGITDASDNGNRQRDGRGEYQSYTTSERDALWARHKDRYLALVGQGLDPNRHCSDIAKALGLTREEGHILHTGYSAWVSMQESHVDLSFLERV